MMTATCVIVFHTEASQRCNQVLRHQEILRLAEEFYTLSGAHKLYGTELVTSGALPYQHKR